MLRSSKFYLNMAMALALSLPCAALAGQKHQGYARTLEDLRMARALLQRAGDQNQNGSQDEVSLAVGNIDGAIDEISKEANIKGGSSRELPAIDPHMQWSVRLSTSMRMLDKAMLDCSKEKDSSGSEGLQAKVLSRLDRAHDRIRVAIDTINFDYTARNLPTRND